MRISDWSSDVCSSDLWYRNCVAIGLSGGFMEPLESTAIHLIQRSLLRFIRMLPAGRVSARNIAEYNDQQDLDAAQIRDFLILHSKVTNRQIGRASCRERVCQYV